MLFFASSCLINVNEILENISFITYKGVLRRGNKRKSSVRSILANPNFIELSDDMVVDQRNGNVWKLI